MFLPDRSDSDLFSSSFLNLTPPQERLGVNGDILTQTLHPLPKSQRRPPVSEGSPRADSTKLFLHPEDDEESPEEVGEDPLDPLA